MVEDLPDGCRAFDHGNDLHGPAAARTEQRIRLVDLADQAHPGSPGFQGRPSVPFGGWLRRGSRPEEPVPLPIAPRPIGVLQRKANQVPPRPSKPRCAAQLTAAGAVIARKPAIIPMSRDRTKTGIASDPLSLGQATAPSLPSKVFAEVHLRFAGRRDPRLCAGPRQDLEELFPRRARALLALQVTP